MSNPGPAGSNYDIKTEIAAYWDRRAESFDESPSHFIRTGNERSTWQQTLTRHFPEPSDGEQLKVLELGCGTGIITELLCDMGCRVTAFDLAENMLKRSRQRVGDRAEIYFGDAEDPFPAEGPFDVIISRHLVWTLPNPEQAFRQWRRRLAPGGRVLIIDGRWMDTGRFRALLKWLADKVEPTGPNPDAPAGLTGAGSPYPYIGDQLPFGFSGPPSNRIAGLLEHCGFRDVRVDPMPGLKRAQREGRPLAFKLRSYATERYLIRATV